jgi:hypothetical protein
MGAIENPRSIGNPCATCISVRGCSLSCCVEGSMVQLRCSRDTVRIRRQSKSPAPNLHQGMHQVVTLVKRGDRWRAQVRRLGQAPLSKTFGSRGEAAAWARDVENCGSWVLSGAIMRNRLGYRPSHCPYMELLHRARVGECLDISSILRPASPSMETARNCQMTPRLRRPHFKRRGKCYVTGGSPFRERV